MCGHKWGWAGVLQSGLTQALLQPWFQLCSSIPGSSWNQGPISHWDLFLPLSAVTSAKSGCDLVSQLHAVFFPRPGGSGKPVVICPWMLSSFFLSPWPLWGKPLLKDNRQTIWRESVFPLGLWLSQRLQLLCYVHEIKVISAGVSGFCILSTHQHKGDLWSWAAHSSNTAKLNFPLKPGVRKDSCPSSVSKPDSLLPAVPRFSRVSPAQAAIFLLCLVVWLPSAAGVLFDNIPLRDQSANPHMSRCIPPCSLRPGKAGTLWSWLRDLAARDRSVPTLGLGQGWGWVCHFRGKRSSHLCLHMGHKQEGNLSCADRSSSPLENSP